ncbi:MAG: anhydro-N-acetylmuramic acid kinase [Pseudomonadota bacterium]
MVNKQYYMGIISGTSVDAVDVAIIDLKDKIDCVATHTHPFPSSLRQSVLALSHGTAAIEDLARTDVLLGRLFAEAVNTILNQSGITAGDIHAIGSHGQTVRHYPDNDIPFTTQIGDPNTIAALTGITTVADFRRKDLVYGGQGAPLAPVFHRQLLGHDQAYAVVNIGGMANITYLPTDPQQPILGFDSGPGNVLLDSWYHQHHEGYFDKDGTWAASGKMNDKLLQQFLDDSYFKRSPPKSTGREYFNLNYLSRYLDQTDEKLSPQDVQASLTALTALSIAKAIHNYVGTEIEVVISGGGVYNNHLMSLLQHYLSPCSVKSIADYGVDPDAVEAMAFAWFAAQTLSKSKIDLTAITGSRQSAVLGGIYFSDSEQ